MKTQHWPIVLLVSLFFLWGAANSLNDILIKQFKKAFTLVDLQASLVQSAFYVGYFMGALPAARLARSCGFKATVMSGLALFALGAILFFPSSRRGGSYPGFLICLYLIAFGLAFLESAANAWIVLLGDGWQQGFGTRALNIAQSFNPLGSVAGIAIGRVWILDGHEAASSGDFLDEYRRHEAARVGLPYVFLGVVVALVSAAFGCTQFPQTEVDHLHEESSTSTVTASLWQLWRTAGFAQSLLAQFSYVGAQTCVWSFVIRLVQEQVPGTSEQRGADFILFGLLAFMAGRFVAAALLRFVSPGRLLTLYASLACTTCIVAACAGGKASVVAVTVTSFFMSMMFPTIFGLSIGLLSREETAIGSALQVMCIIGGAVMTPVMGVVSDASSVALAYLVPGGCFLSVMSYAVQQSLGLFDGPENKPLL